MRDRELEDFELRQRQQRHVNHHRGNVMAAVLVIAEFAAYCIIGYAILLVLDYVGNGEVF